MHRLLPILSILFLSLTASATLTAPTGLQATAAGPTAIALSWEPDPAATGYELQRAVGASWTNLTNRSGQTRHAYDRGLSVNTPYEYRVRATNSISTSSWSQVGPVSTTIRMNILFFFADDMGYKDIVHLRNPEIDGPTIYETPAIDSLASQALIIENAYCSGPRCVVARRSVLTGKVDWRPEAIPSNKYYLDHDNDPLGGGLFAGGVSVNPETSGQQIPDNMTYGEAAQLGGYRTCYIGKYHLGQSDDQPARGPTEQGFDVSIAAGHAGAPPESYFPTEDPPGSGSYTYYLPNLADSTNPNEYLTDRLTDEAIGFIQDSVTHHPASPFFLTLAHYAVHTPVEAKSADINYFTAKKTAMSAELATHPMAATPLLADSGVNTRMIQDNRVYAAMMKSYDDSLANLRASLASIDDPRHPGMKLSDTTIIVVSSDHGGKSTTPVADAKALEDDSSDPVNDRSNNAYSAYPTSNYPFRQGKTWVYEGGLKIPLIVHVPGLTPPDSQSRAFVHGADFFATFTDMCAAPQQPAEAQDSISFMLTAGQPERSARQESHHFFTNANKGTGNPAIAAYRKGDYKLLYFIVQRRLELYNLAADPYERVDLSSRRPDLAEELFREVYAQHLSTGAKMPKPGSNSWTSEQQDVLLRNGLIPALPAVPHADPDQLVVTPLSPGSLQLSWKVNASNATHSVIYRRADAEGETGYREVAFVPVTVTNWIDRNLIQGGQYRYRVESENLGGWASNSTANVSVTLPATGAPLPIQAENDTITTVPGETRVFSPLLNDLGEGSLRITAISQPSMGTATYSDQHIHYTAPPGFSGNLTMTYTVQDDSNQTANAVVQFELPVPPVGTEVERWDFNETTGSLLHQTSSDRGLRFGTQASDAIATANGSLLLSSGSAGGVNSSKTTNGDITGAPYSDGRVTLEYGIRDLDLRNSPNGLKIGFTLRDGTSAAAVSDFGMSRLHKANGVTTLEVQIHDGTGYRVFHLIDFATNQITDLRVRATLDLDAFTIEHWLSLDQAEWLQLDTHAANPNLTAADQLKFQSNISGISTNDQLSIDYLSVTREAPALTLYNAWSESFGWNGNLATDAYADADGDGMLNIYEFGFGRSPVVSNTVMSDIELHLDGNTPQLRFTPIRDPGTLRYSLQVSTNLLDWPHYATAVGPAGSPVSLALPPGSTGFGRIVVHQ